MGYSQRSARGDVLGPVGHQRAALLEQIASPVGGFNAVAVDVRQGELADLPWYLGPLRGPVPKAGPEAVRYGADTEFAQQLGEGAVAEHAPGGRREYEAAPVDELPRLVEDAHRAPGQWHPVLKLGLHARRRYCPGGRGLVHLDPSRPADLARAASGEHEDLERECRRAVRLRCAHPSGRFGDLRVRQRPLVPAAHAVLRERGGNGVARRVVLAVALRDRPLHDGANPLADSAGGFPFRGPDRKQDLHDVGGGHAVHAFTADPRHGVVAQAGAPLGGGLAAVFPVFGVDLDDGLHGLLEGRGAAGLVAQVAALGDDPRVGERLLPRAGEGDDGVGAEADVGGLAVEAYPLGSRFGEAAVGCRFDEQAQAMSAAPVAVPAGDVDGVDESGGESFGAFPRVPCYHFRYHDYGK